jgi:hypothetical protein
MSVISAGLIWSNGLVIWRELGVDPLGVFG